MDAREGLSPPYRGLQSRAWILGHRAMRCQGGDRTPAFRLTAGRLTPRLPGIGYRDGESNPALRVEGPVSWPLDHRGMQRKRGDSNAQGLGTPTCFRDRLLIQPGRFPDGALGGSRTHGLVPTENAL